MGDEPAEIHEYRDADGEPCAMADAWTTVVTREPEWDDESRDLVLDLREHDQMIHHGCGNHMSVSMDSNLSRVVNHHRLVCQDCRAIDLARKEWHKEQRHEGDIDRCQVCGDEQFYIERRDPITGA